MTDLGFIYDMGFPEPQNGSFQVMKRAITGHGTGCFLLQNRFFQNATQAHSKPDTNLSAIILNRIHIKQRG